MGRLLRWARPGRRRAAGRAGNPRVTTRRIESLKADKRRFERERDGHERKFYKSDGKTVHYVETHEAATGAHREHLLQRIAHIDEQVAYWQDQPDELAASGEFVPWMKDHFVVGDHVRRSGFDGWHEVQRVNPKSVTVLDIHGYKATVKWDEVRGRRRDDVQLDAPNSQPWPVELATKVARWNGLLWCTNGGQSSHELMRDRTRMKIAQNIVLGLSLEAGQGEIDACLQGVPDLATARPGERRVRRRLRPAGGGETATDISATHTPIELQAAWRAPAGEPEARISAKTYTNRDREDIFGVQRGDLVVGWYDDGRDRTLMRNFAGPVTSVSEARNEREHGDWVTITIEDGQKRDFQTHQWLAVHPAGTWESNAAAEVVTNQPEPPAGDTALDGHVERWNAAVGPGDQQRIDEARKEMLGAVTERIMNDDPNAVKAGWTPTVAAATYPVEAADDDGPDLWGPVLDEQAEARAQVPSWNPSTTAHVFVPNLKGARDGQGVPVYCVAPCHRHMSQPCHAPAGQLAEAAGR